MKKSATVATLAVVLVSAGALWGQETPASGKNLGSVTGGEFKTAMEVIEKKCTVCHSSSRISSALKTRKDMLEIQMAMEKKGAKLSSNERQVLGIYWKEPLKEKRK